MLDVKKWMAKVSDYLRKSLVGTVSNVYWWQNSWTAPSDGMMVLRITPNNNSAWYWYINDSSISGTTGSWSHQFRGANNNTFTSCIPVKKGATYSTAASSNLNTIYCFFYPMKVGGVLLNSIFKAFSDFMSLLKIGGGLNVGRKETAGEDNTTLLKGERPNNRQRNTIKRRLLCAEFGHPCVSVSCGNNAIELEQRNRSVGINAVRRVTTRICDWYAKHHNTEFADKDVVHLLTISERRWAVC